MSSHHKIRVATRKRMAKTGESYGVARREVVKEHAAAEAKQFRLAPGITEIITSGLPETAGLRTAAAEMSQLGGLASLTACITGVFTAADSAEDDEPD
jgi:hypothetical protein